MTGNIVVTQWRRSNATHRALNGSKLSWARIICELGMADSRHRPRQQTAPPETNKVFVLSAATAGVCAREKLGGVEGNIAHACAWHEGRRVPYVLYGDPRTSCSVTRQTPTIITTHIKQHRAKKNRIFENVEILSASPSVNTFRDWMSSYICIKSRNRKLAPKLQYLHRTELTFDPMHRHSSTKRSYVIALAASEVCLMICVYVVLPGEPTM